MAAANPTLHPVRLRIIQALLGNEFTTAQLRERMPDIAPATLYRHIAALHEADVLEVAREERVRGATERCYRLRTTDLLMRSGHLTQEDHQVAFSVFTGALMADFERYLAAPDTDPEADGLAYRQAAVWLDADEHAALAAEITRAVSRYADAGPGPGRTRHVIGYVDIPEGTPS
ncbi:helix-turn-helix domain-containing protein [Streptomyces griseus]|uniref:helix-turn-helix domain-containing protein n=1 Tax=Streptomyces griseus TaxID=1911 RepID=UPI0036C5A544